jgi:hypothetical protein
VKLKKAIAEAIYFGVNDECNLSMRDCEKLADAAIKRWEREVARSLSIDPLAHMRHHFK